jgi:hypothetical protein
MLMVLAIAAMRLQDHDVATLKGTATDPAEAIVHTPDPTAHERTQHGCGLLIKRLA